MQPKTELTVACKWFVIFVECILTRFYLFIYLCIFFSYVCVTLLISFQCYVMLLLHAVYMSFMYNCYVKIALMLRIV